MGVGAEDENTGKVAVWVCCDWLMLEQGVRERDCGDNGNERFILCLCCVVVVIVIANLNIVSIVMVTCRYV